MSSTDGTDDSPSSRRAGQPGERRPGAHQYFQAIETTFIALRGAPLLLAPADWQVARSWHQEGIPLRLVERKLAEIFERASQREGEDGKRRLVTLRYCRRAIENAWKKQRDLMAPAQVKEEAPAFDIPGRLGKLAAALPPSLDGVEDVARQVRGLEGEAEAVEEQLMALDREVLASARRALDPEAAATLESRLTAALRPLIDRLAEAELERARERLSEQILRELQTLPILSLFSPEAE